MDERQDDQSPHDSMWRRDVPADELRWRGELRALAREFSQVRAQVVFPASIGWELPYLFQRPQQMARALARIGCLVFYAEPDYEGRHPDGFERIEERLYIANVPPQVFAELESPVAVVMSYSGETLRFLRRPRVVYEYLDSLDLLGATARLVRAHRTLLGRATVVTATSSALWEEIAPLRPDAVLCPNGVEIEPFARLRGRRAEPPEDLRARVAGASTIVGYVGTVTEEWFDYELVRAAAQARPNHAFVLIGADYTGGLARSGLLDLPNIHWLGPRRYEDLPGYLACFDVATIPFLRSSVTEASSPLKLFEYLAAGRPVVTTPIRECANTPTVLVASTGEELAQRIDQAVPLLDDPGFLAASDAVARGATWETRAEQVLRALSADRRAALANDDTRRLRWQLEQMGDDLAEAEMAVATQAWTVGALREQKADAERADAIERAELHAAAERRVAVAEDAAHTLAEVLRRRDEEAASLRQELRAVTSSTGWKLVVAQRRARRAFARASERAWRTIAPVRLRAATARAWRRAFPVPFQMSWPAYAFDVYKRRRQSVHGSSLARVSCPSEPGLVSIVLPVLNGEKMLPAALDSILAQTYPRFELIAIDDGSTDATGRILDEYAARDARIRVIHQENRKIPRSLSRGFRQARGELLTWTSADNRLAPDFLARMIDCLARHPDWDMVYANVDMIGPDGAPLRGSSWYAGYQHPPGSEHVRLPFDSSDLGTVANNYVGAAFLYRDRVRHLIGDYGRHRFGIEDYDYWMRVNDLMTLRHADFVEPVYQYCFGPDTLTARDRELGITRDRVRLMVFDDFRRDFFLSPLAWVLEVDEGVAGASALASELRGRIAAAGHVLIEPERWRTLAWPRLWAPVAHVRIGARVATAPTDDRLADLALRVLVVPSAGPASSAEAAPIEVTPGWDLRIRADACAPAGGWLAIPDPQALFTAIDIRTRSAHLERIEDEIHVPPAPDPSIRISVIVCTLRRADKLAECLESLAEQRLADGAFEIVVVSNDPADGRVPAVVDGVRARRFAASPDRVRLVDCVFPGLSHARNAGLAEARGDILVFVDDDAVARPDLLAHIEQAFDEHSEVGLVGGHIRLAPPEPQPEVLAPGRELYWSQFLTGYREYTPVEHWWELPWGANWSVRRAALAAIGGFRTQYGRRGDDFAGGEELTAARLVQQLGYTVAIEPRAEVLHVVEEQRYTWEHVRRTILAGTMVNYQAQRDLYVPRETSMRRTTMEIARLGLKAVRDRARGASRDEQRILGFRIAAQGRLLARQLRDASERLRRPAVLAPSQEGRANATLAGGASAASSRSAAPAKQSDEERRAAGSAAP